MPLWYTDDGEIVIGPNDPTTGLPPTGCDREELATKNSWRCRGYGAATCQLYPCIRTYEASIADGVLNETLVDETPQLPAIFSDTDDSVIFRATLNRSCLSPTDLETLGKIGPEFDEEQAWIPYNLTNRLSSTNASSEDASRFDFERALQQRDCLYAIDGAFTDNTSDGVLELAWSGVLVGYRVRLTPGIAMFDGPQILQSLYNAGDFGFERTQKLFKNVSDSLSDYMRMHPGNYTPVGDGADTLGLMAPALGTVYKEKVCLRVRWRWLALPAALVILTLVFFAMLLIQQREAGHGVRTWSSSALPLLFFGPEIRRLETKSPDTQSLDSVESVAKQIMVGLATDADGKTCLAATRSDSKSDAPGAGVSVEEED